MYIGEFILWLGSAIKPETRKKLKKDYSDNSMKLSEVAKDYTTESVSHNPRPIGPYYAYNDRYLEIRGGMLENFRGIITWISLAIFFITASGGYFALKVALKLYNNEWDNYKIGSGIFAMVFFAIIFLVSAYLCIRYFRYICRLELFTLRHVTIP
ncbi:hypothetical protein A9G24_08700 [Gilliamella sp. App6-5]|uniref:hypothetical protein n=1 Tax=Gilliamella sp. App6-5 TaxID=3120232 RepID=UPI00080DF2DB|nr:hypothetical protein [Gilliamella apicola]OCG12427.1 hypothetical protein A9G24_08700 [Gilliamella apicola]